MRRSKRKEVPSWCCVQTHHAQETRAAGSLEAKGFFTYLPRLCTETVSGGKVKRAWEPLFPRYLLVALPLYADGEWQTARYARGVRSILSSPSGTPLRMPDAVFMEIHKRCGGDLAQLMARVVSPERHSRPYEQGDSVRLLSGPFADWNGFVKLAKRDRVTVMLSVFGRKTETEVDARQLELVA